MTHWPTGTLMRRATKCMYHLGMVKKITEHSITVHTLATKSANINNAKWGKLFQRASGAYILGEKRKNIPVEDEIPTAHARAYVWASGVKLTQYGKLTAASRKQLLSKGLPTISWARRSQEQKLFTAHTIEQLRGATT